ncbi:MAG TPA: serine/threonine-protein kinase, partial [Kofleriaceae bacterium]|nr:serine/threonine-protein kinase [Kofleriaceae bacterium]
MTDHTDSAAVTGPPAHGHDPIVVTLGETVGRYQVRRMLGEGGMGQVYLARDVVLGRSVALKIVGPTTGAGLHTERFLHEARAIARLNHPNVVQLYDFGEYRGGLYLALEYVEGGTLRERASHGPLALDEVLRHARAIADGLAHAHGHGVFHCDLKPSNVMVGKDGRVRVVDFGIARTGENAASTKSGTPDWMAPEQWLGAPASDRTDSWALGIVVAQLLTDGHPLGDTVEARRDAVQHGARPARWVPARGDVPAAVIDLVNRALAHTPSERPTAAEWARVLDVAILDGRADPALDDGPFRGLAAFDERHARFYFGRELEIDAFLERLRDTPYLPIVGPSGAGKSSFLHAGVIPRLRAREPWTVIAIRPGGDPIGALARGVLGALADHGDRKAQVQAFRDELIAAPTLLAARLSTIASVQRGKVLLAVDQLEEAFTHGASEAERAAFLHMLAVAADDPLDPVRVVVTVRDDFVGKLAGLRALFVVKKLGVDDVRRTITAPVAREGYQFDDPAIVDDLIAEVGVTGDRTGNLPLLQFACRTLWDGRDPARRRVLRATYREMGGLAGALARHADHALAELSDDERRIARQLLLQLVVGTTRRSVPRPALGHGHVLDRLLAARLVVQRQAGDGDAPIVEIAHESLLQTWTQLARWVDETRDERRLLDELLDATSLWERRGRR